MSKDMSDMRTISAPGSCDIDESPYTNAELEKKEIHFDTDQNLQIALATAGPVREFCWKYPKRHQNGGPNSTNIPKCRATCPDIGFPQTAPDVDLVVATFVQGPSVGQKPPQLSEPPRSHRGLHVGRQSPRGLRTTRRLGGSTRELEYRTCSTLAFIYSYADNFMGRPQTRPNHSASYHFLEQKGTLSTLAYLAT